jgi:serine/threonine protein kinase
MNQATATHPANERLSAFSWGKLDEGDAKEIAAHLETCADCQRVVETQPDDALISLVRKVVTTTMAASTVTLIESWLPTELLSHPRYRLIRWLGAGGMGVVYQAEHRLMERLVALKIISKKLTDNAVTVARFQKEVKAAAKLSHPNIVASYDAEQAGDLHFLVMEFIEGTSLARLVEDRGPLPVSLACDYVRQVALGLQHASEHGLVHRDIKPQNLMLTPNGQVKILDFGLAGFVSENGPVGSLTELGQGLGTPDYVAPEQIRDTHSADIRSDIYSLGCTLYFLLTGQPPFPEGSVSQKVAAQLERMPRAISDLRRDLPDGLAQVVERLMAKTPDRRYQKPVEVAEALAPFSIKREEGRQSASIWRKLKPNRHLISFGLVLGAAVIASVFIFDLPGKLASGNSKAEEVEKSSVSKNKDEEKLPVSKGKEGKQPPIPTGNEEEKGSANSKPTIADGQGQSRFSEIELEKPFDKYLLAKPLLMEVTGARIIRLPGGNQVIISIASIVLKNNSPEERVNAERVCRIRAITSVVAGKEGVHVYRVEEAKEQRLIILENGKETGKSVSEVLELTQTTVKGLTKDMPVVGRWNSQDGGIYYLAIGIIIDRKGLPVPE